MKEKTKSIVDSYKEFALKGNLIDLAIAVVIGNAFSRITQSLVNHIIMPLLSLLIGDINFTDLKVVFKPATVTTAEVALNYGNFIQVVIEFIIISIAVFVVFRFLTRLRENKNNQGEEKASTNEVKLLEEIRDILKNK